MPAVNTSSDQARAFEEQRGRLWRVAYRMLGSRAEAEDVVQDAYLRWHRADTGEIRSPQAWLVTTVTRLALDRLRQLRAERERYTGPWLPEPLVAEPAPPAEQAAELASDLSVAFLAVLERLAPEERAAFLLHEVFDSDYGDIAKVLGKSEVACRQIVSRARKRVKAERPRMQVSQAASARLVDGFMQALRSQDREAMLKLLAADASWTSDGGGKTKAALKVLSGAPKVARFATNVYRKAIDRVEFRPVTVNGEPGVATLLENRLFAVMALRTDGRRILDVYAILNPDKLKGIDVSPR
jgi:RNA polymerase sigma-70 factor (ECF subfamily)